MIPFQEDPPSDTSTRTTLLDSDFVVGDRVRILNPRPFQPREGVIIGSGRKFINIRGNDNSSISRAPKNLRLEFNANMADTEEITKRKSQHLESTLAQLRLFGAQVRDKVNTPSVSRSKASKYGTPEASIQSPASLTATPKIGAYPSPGSTAKSLTSQTSKKLLPPTEIATSGRNKYRIFLAPLDDSIQSFCFSNKGSGGETFCTNMDCRIALHKTKPKFSVEKGDIFIEKTQGAAFSKKYLNASSLSIEVMESCLTSLNSLEDWVKLFRLASVKLEVDTKVDKKIDFKDLQQAQSDQSKLEYWKTPAKRKIIEDSGIENKHQKLMSKDLNVHSSEDIVKIISMMDDRVTQLLNSLDFLRTIQVEDSTLVFDYFTAADNKIQHLF